MAEKKHSAFALLKILTEYSDMDHILTTKQLQSLLKDQYGLDLERRTLYSNLDILEQAGYEIDRYEDNGKGYYLVEKQFTKGEVLLLCNAIHASHFISTNQSEKLINKLLKTQSKYEKKEYQNNVYMPNYQKTPNRELMINIELLSEAIRDGKCIQFTYMKYDSNKKLVPRREEPYIVEPRYIVYADSRAYLIATNKKYSNYTHYRIDRISKVKVLEDEPVKQMPKNQDAYEYAKNKLFMYAGDMEQVTFLCKEQIMDSIIDIFGTDVFVSPQADGKFIIHVTTSPTGAKYLAQQFLDAMEIVEPKDLREEFVQQLKETLGSYEGN